MKSGTCIKTTSRRIALVMAGLAVVAAWHFVFASQDRTFLDEAPGRQEVGPTLTSRGISETSKAGSAIDAPERSNGASKVPISLAVYSEAGWPIRDPYKVTLSRLEKPDHKIIAPFGENGSVDALWPLPISTVTITIVDPTGATVTRQYTRSAEQAASPWQLGRIVVPNLYRLDCVLMIDLDDNSARALGKCEAVVAASRTQAPAIAKTGIRSVFPVDPAQDKEIVKTLWLTEPGPSYVRWSLRTESSIYPISFSSSVTHSSTSGKFEAAIAKINKLNLIRGRVRNQDHTALPQITVTLDYPTSNRQIKTRTDSYGCFLVPAELGPVALAKASLGKQTSQEMQCRTGEQCELIVDTSRCLRFRVCLHDATPLPTFALTTYRLSLKRDGQFSNGIWRTMSRARPDGIAWVDLDSLNSERTVCIYNPRFGEHVHWLREPSNSTTSSVVDIVVAQPEELGSLSFDPSHPAITWTDLNLWEVNPPAHCAPLEYSVASPSGLPLRIWPGEYRYSCSWKGQVRTGAVRIERGRTSTLSVNE